MSSWSEPGPQRIEPFEYVEAASGGVGEQVAAAADEPDDTQRMTDIAVAEAFERGKRAGASEAEQRFERALDQARRQIQNALAQFAEERTAYFKTIEAEVVQLSLAIARRVIEREALVDDCLLAGMVRVALERLDSTTRVRVRVRPEMVERWRSELDWARSANIEWVPDASLTGEVCRFETDLGSTEIGVESRMKEVEQSFFDLLACRPEIGKPTVMQ